MVKVKDVSKAKVYSRKTIAQIVEDANGDTVKPLAKDLQPQG